MSGSIPSRPPSVIDVGSSGVVSLVGPDPLAAPPAAGSYLRITDLTAVNANPIHLTWPAWVFEPGSDSIVYLGISGEYSQTAACSSSGAPILTTVWAGVTYTFAAVVHAAYNFAVPAANPQYFAWDGTVPPVVPRALLESDNTWALTFDETGSGSGDFQMPRLQMYGAYDIATGTTGSFPLRRYPPVNNSGSGPTRHYPRTVNRRAGGTY